MNKQTPTLLVTGGAGFIGSNFITYFLQQHSDYQLVNIDKLTYAGTTDNLSKVSHVPNYHFINGDISDEKLIHSIFTDFDITGVIHFAAESHVDRSIQDVTPFIETNVTGTMVLLQEAKKAWEQKGVLQERRFHHISTDEIYGSLEETGKFNEQTPLDPRNPYSASKASSNLLVKSFGYTYGMNVVISSSSNNYGPRQHEEKLIPTIIRKAIALEPIPIYGDGQNVRDWLYVTDHCRALDIIYHHGTRLETYNIGGGNEQTNIDIARDICAVLDQLKPEIKAKTSIGHFADLIQFTKDRPGHDRRYAVDDTKIRKTLGWKPEVTFDDGLKQTVEWYTNQWISVPR